MFTLVNEHLTNKNIKICTVIGFPLGANTLAIKIAEAELAIAQRATELDLVINIGALKSGDVSLVLAEMVALWKLCCNGIILKVIIETALLTTNEKIIACELATKANVDFVKTATGFASHGATIADIILIKNHISPAIKIKASGGIKTQKQALALIAAGAVILVTLNSGEIISNITNDQCDQ